MLADEPRTGSTFDERLRGPDRVDQRSRSASSWSWTSPSRSISTTTSTCVLAIRAVVAMAISSVRTRQSLAVREQRYRILAENSSDVVYLSDRDQRVVWVAPGWPAFSGGSRRTLSAR